MLNRLFVQNYALIQSLEFCPSKGFISITGETGAGKSILVGALSLLLGKRADVGVLYDKELKCVVEGIWQISNSESLNDFFISNDLDFENQIILRREINAQGKSRAFINDTPVSLNILKELSGLLVNVSSQHETINLLSADYQMDMLDNFAGIMNLRNDYSGLFKESKLIIHAIEKLEKEEKLALKEKDFLDFQWNELDMLKYSLGEFASLDEEQKILENSELISSSLLESLVYLDNEENGIIVQLDYLLNKLRKVSNFHSEIKELTQRIQSNYLDIKDIKVELESLSTDMEIKPNRLDFINERLNSINTLAFKHRVKQADELLDVKSDIENKIETLQNLSFEKSALEKQWVEVQKNMEKSAKELSKLRHKSSKLVENSLNLIVRELGMPDAVFQIDISDADEYNSTGKDKVEFLFSANKGSLPAIISKVASGGELSRLMLALKIVAGKENQVSTMIFDEIDTGISGFVADAVGKKLQDLSKFVQVISITHLPQIAGKSDHQFKVFKEIKHDKTYTGIKQLTQNERVDELAIMISGKDNSIAAEAAAKELLQR